MLVGGGPSPSTDNAAVALTLWKITRRHVVLSFAVPVVGLVLASIQGRLGEVWIIIAIVLTAAAGAYWL